MSALTTLVVAFVLAIVVAALVWGGAGLVIALPVALVVLAIAFVLNLGTRPGSRSSFDAERERAEHPKVEFTERDEQTLVKE